MSNLIEGRDYVMENGYCVFTSRFLWERGHCCGNGCRNCPYSFPNDKKVVSLVPSWTDTLIRCGVTLIGRSRFCVHPEEEVQAIPKVGGTKQCDFARINGLDPDLVVLDKEENAKEFPDSHDAPAVVTHVKDIPSMVSGMIELNRKVKNKDLNRLIKQAGALRPLPPDSLSVEQLPGVIRWIARPSGDIRTLVYLIWKDPWMSVSRQTFIGSVLEFLGYGRLLPDFDEKYPEVCLEDFDRDSTLFLFSSEPYPFARQEGLIGALKVNAAIVQGEHYCWYGMKSLEFLSNASASLSPQHRRTAQGTPVL